MKKKKILIIALAVVLSMGLLVGFIMTHHWFIPLISDDLSISAHTSYQPDMYAHRGLSSLAPQNTIPAVELTVEYGYDGCEFDLHTTKDGKWVVIHDEYVDDMTDGEGAVADMTFEEIRALNIDDGYGIENYENLKIPTLEEVLEVLKGTDTIPVVEIKNGDIDLIPVIKETLDKYGLADTAEIISFNREYLEKYRELDEDAKLTLLVVEITEDDVQWCVDNKVETISFHFLSFYKSVKGWLDARNSGVELAAWTVDNTVFKDVMVLLGAKAITTNQLILKK